ncbi:MAG: hypothetical protein JNK15_00625 [Planctomycetes bacterium]|nr:hypothetical protein [Planctomycetota bacterium]
MERATSLLLAIALGSAGRTQEAVRVAGVVVDEIGTPLADVVVEGIDQAATTTFVTGESPPLARSNGDGTFEFAVAPGRHAPMLLALHAAGRGTVVVGSAYSNLAPIVLPRAHRIAGRLRLPNGAAATGVRVEVRDWLSVFGLLAGRGPTCAIAAEPRSAVRTGADGRFVVDCAADICLGVRIGGGAFRIHDLGPLASDAPLDLVVHPVAQRPVAVFDPDGKPVGNVIVTCDSDTTLAWPKDVSARTDANGACTLPLAPGIAVTAHTEDYHYAAWAMVGDSSTTCELRLAATALVVKPPEATATTRTVSGKFVDPDSGLPIANGLVWAVADGQPGFVPLDPVHRFVDGQAPRDALCCRTRTDGTFSLPLEPGTWWLGAAENATGSPWHWLGTARNPTPRQQKIGADDVVDLQLQLQPTQDLRGQLTPARWPAGTHLRFVPENNWATSSGVHLACSPRTAVQADGTFLASDLQAGPTRIELLLPRLFRQGPHDRVLLEVRQRNDATPVQLDAAQWQPAIVRGRLQSEIPPERLAVVSMAPTDPKGMLYGTTLYDGPVAPVGRDRSFVLREPAGTRTLVVIDTLTGVMLHRGAPRQVQPNGDAELAIEVATHRVEVTFVNLPDTDNLWLQPRVSSANQPNGLGQMTDLDNRGTGCHVPSDQTRLDLWLPIGSARLELVRDHRHRDERVVASAAIDARAGQHGKVTLIPE